MLKTKIKLTLIGKINNKETNFHIVPTSTILTTNKNSNFVTKDSYFRIQHISTKCWLSYYEDKDINNLANKNFLRK